MRLENVIKQKLRNGEVVMGIFDPIPSPEVVEVLALAGFDFILLDAEHGRISPGDAYPMILAAEARDVPIFVRVGQNDRQVILKYLDLGVDALPHVKEILATPGLDVLFVGPSDLGQSMGYGGQYGIPEVEAVIQQVIDAAKGTGVALAIVAPDIATVNKRIAQGFQMIVPNAPGLLMKASRDLLAAVERP
jgi:2-keto-3-deoxy-L-rhamnonate aldolase RhmA